MERGSCPGEQSALRGDGEDGQMGPLTFQLGPGLVLVCGACGSCSKGDLGPLPGLSPSPCPAPQLAGPGRSGLWSWALALPPSRPQESRCRWGAVLSWARNSQNHVFKPLPLGPGPGGIRRPDCRVLKSDHPGIPAYHSYSLGQVTWLLSNLLSVKGG